MRFRIEYLQAGEPACVMARQLGEGDFRVGAGSTLGGVAVKPIASQGKAAGVYAFWLRSAADLAKFAVGDEVELRG